VNRQVYGCGPFVSMERYVIVGSKNRNVLEGGLFVWIVVSKSMELLIGWREGGKSLTMRWFFKTVSSFFFSSESVVYRGG